MLTNLNKIEAPLDKLILGFTEIQPQPTWSIYLDTWRMIDEGEETIEKLPLYKLMLKHYCGKNRKRRTYEKQLLGLDTINCKTIAKTWVQKHIELYHSIKTEGFHPERRKNPIRIRIQNDGGLYLLDGTHTVSILRHLNLCETITAKVHTRDGGWETLKHQLYEIYGEKLLYQPIEHPDFADWRVDRASPHRWEIIKETLGDVTGKHILDVGCMTGWFSHRLAQHGAQVTGIEPHKKRYDTCKTLSLYYGLTEDNPRFLQESFEEHLKHNHYEVVLVLSVIHHYLRQDPKLFYEAVQILGKGCDSMILEMGVNHMPIRWHPKLVLQYSDYTKYRILYDGERPIYLYTKEA